MVLVVALGGVALAGAMNARRSLQQQTEDIAETAATTVTATGPQPAKSVRDHPHRYLDLKDHLMCENIRRNDVTLSHVTDGIRGTKRYHYLVHSEHGYIVTGRPLDF